MIDWVLAGFPCGSTSTWIWRSWCKKKNVKNLQTNTSLYSLYGSMISVYIPGHAPAQQSWMRSGFFHCWHTGGEDGIFIFTCAWQYFGISNTRVFCHHGSQFLWFASVFCRSVFARCELTLRCWVFSSPQVLPAEGGLAGVLPHYLPCLPLKAVLVSSPEVPWVTAWPFSVNQMWTNLRGSGHYMEVLV